MRLLWRSSRRYLIQHPWLLGLSVLGVAVGVAVVVGIDLANSSAQRAFMLSAESVGGKATHQVRGATDMLDEAVYRSIRLDLGFRDAAPVVEGYAVAEGRAGRVFQVLGIDPFAEAPFRPYVGGGSGVDLAAFMARPRSVLLVAATAAGLGLETGDTLSVAVAGQPQPLVVVGLLEPGNERSARAMADLLVVDIATAQELFDMAGRLSRIDLILTDDAEGEALQARLTAALPLGAELVRSSSRTEILVQMTRAFELNLTALSLLALVVGMFLIYNTITFSVVQRRPLLGRMRVLGVTRREIFLLVLAEAAVVGTVGTGVGLLLGIVLGQGLVQLVTQTINDLYFVVTVNDLALTPWTVLKGAGLGLGATLVAAFAPAHEAATAPAAVVLQRSQAEVRARAWVPGLALAGLGLALVGVALLLASRTSIVVSYGALFAVLMAFALATPAAVLLCARALRPVLGRLFGVLGRMAASGIAATLSRTAVAVAALMIAVASTVGVGVMVDSFRKTVEVWLEYALQADVYIQPPGSAAQQGTATIGAGLVEQVRRVPGVAGVASVRRRQVNTAAGPATLVAIEAGLRTEDAFRFKQGDPAAVWPAFYGGNGVLISEPYGYRHELQAGDEVRLPTDRGEEAFVVTGVYYDYASDIGTVMMSRSTYERYYDDRGYTGVSVYAAEGRDVDALIEDLRRAVGGEQDLDIRSNIALRSFSLEVFDRTFTITTVLRLLAVLVAFVGVLSALMSLQLERARELAVLRANGLTPRQVWHHVTLQTGLMGLLSGLFALPLGLVLAFVLIFVINKRSFGWTLQVEVAPEILLQAVLVAFIAAVLAGLYPAWKMARTNPALALREA